MRGFRHLLQVVRVVAVVLRNPDLRRQQVAFFFFNGAEWGVWIAMLVYAYERGGATLAGLVALVQLVPAALFAPFAALLADRHRPAAVLLGGYLAQALAMGATAAVLLAGGPSWLAYLSAATAATAVTITRPTLAVLTPALARVPAELTASNVVSGWNESISLLVAPALTGVVLTVGSPGFVFLGMGVAVFVGAMLVLPVRGPAAGARTVAIGGARELLEGFRVLRREPAARLLVGLLGSQYVAIGMLDVLYVVLAIGSLGLGQGGAGYLNASFGAGGALGVAVTASLVGRARLMPAVASALVAWAVAFGLLAVWSQAAGAVLMLAVAGAARSLFDVAGRTLLQRTAPSDVLARVFGILEALIMAGTAVGALVAPLLVNLAGATAGIIGVGAVLPVLALLGGRRLWALDASARVPVVELGLLRSLDLFSALPPPELEGLAQKLEPLSVSAGEVVVTQGEQGDRYYAIADGELEVVQDDRLLNLLGRGDGFGEIALLHGVRRTATVRAVTDAHLYALEQEPFLLVLNRHPHSRAAAEEIAAGRLATRSPH